MDYSNFLKTITERIRERVSDEYTVETHAMRKNNGVMLDSLMIRRPDDMVCPNIYLNDIYRWYLDGASMDQLTDRILDTYHNAAAAMQIRAEELITPEIIRRQVVRRMINYEKNRDLLANVPHRRFLDLALIYYVMVHNDRMGEGAIMVRNDFLDLYSMDASEIEEEACQNTRSLLPADFLRISDLLREFGEKCGAHSYSDITLEEESVESPLYVLTNRSRQFGACYMADTEVLSGIAGRLESDVYILPSSVHECMIVPAEQWEDTSALSEMVREINRTQVSEEEYLSNTIYRFRRETQKVETAV
jgi:hypothetical protein